ncbi:DUF2243 domain-containing protein [Pseudomonas sp.]|uniref:DUF2243 domain-containing protein n=1 Tax=Pseudomonas sp. TaxID=306 RepID=UPI00272B51C8|nr:DUF2243 domain-containing protein [Pseudomonas sp.]
MSRVQVGLDDRRRSLWYAVPLGIGLMAGVDEIVFHQLLQWHHFYDGATTTVGIFTDGLLHAGELIALAAGSFLLIGLARRGALAKPWAWAGALLGAGGFQLFDGLVNHKLLRLHQVRYEVNLLPYDIAWNASAGVLIVLGLLVLMRARRSAGV